MNFFQNPVTDNMDDIIVLHNWVMFSLIFILNCVLYVYINILYYFFVFKEREDNELSFSFREILTLSNIKQLKHAAIAETAWTVAPFMIVALIMVPSFILLYIAETDEDPDLTIKAVGHQWYWTYETSKTIVNFDRDLFAWTLAKTEATLTLKKIHDIVDYYPRFFLFPELYNPAFVYPPIPVSPVYLLTEESNTSIVESFDSYIKPEAELPYGEFRLLEVNNALILPSDRTIRVIVTATDVLHSWAVPSFGIKIDAVPGRLNQVLFKLNREGIFYGQCSELCGTGHGFMPIKVLSIYV